VEWSSGDRNYHSRKCISIELVAEAIGLVFYVIGLVQILRNEYYPADVFVVIGWTSGCGGHVFGMLGAYIGNRRRDMQRRAGGQQIEMPELPP